MRTLQTHSKCQTLLAWMRNSKDILGSGLGFTRDTPIVEFGLIVMIS